MLHYQSLDSTVHWMLHNYRITSIHKHVNSSWNTIHTPCWYYDAPRIPVLWSMCFILYVLEELTKHLVTVMKFFNMATQLGICQDFIVHLIIIFTLLLVDTAAHFLTLSPLLHTLLPFSMSLLSLRRGMWKDLAFQLRKKLFPSVHRQLF